MFLFQSQTLNFTRDSSQHPVSWGCLAILQDVTKTGQDDLDRELLDHWLRDPGKNTLQQIPALVVSL